MPETSEAARRNNQTHKTVVSIKPRHRERLKLKFIEVLYLAPSVFAAINAQNPPSLRTGREL
jgi:hypothetical protein